MIIRVKELCLVDYINEDDAETNEEQFAVRTVEYESEKETLLEAFKDYTENFDSDNIISSDDEFEGQCLGTIKYISLEDVED